MRRGIIGGLIIGLLATSALAQIQEGSKPAVGEIATASIGSPMLTEYRFRGVPGVVLHGDIAANWGTAESVALAAGTPLVIIRPKKVKACQTRTNLGWVNCVIDTDDDGRFDRVSFNDVGGAKNIVPPVPYDKEPVQMGVNARFGEGNDFKRVYVFTGVSGDTLTISYREFVNDLARPAFTENLSLPLSKEFPQSIALKNRVFEITGVDGMGLHYKLVK